MTNVVTSSDTEGNFMGFGPDFRFAGDMPIPTVLGGLMTLKFKQMPKVKCYDKATTRLLSTAPKHQHAQWINNGSSLSTRPLRVPVVPLANVRFYPATGNCMKRFWSGTRWVYRYRP
ncbi:hypothetical protein IAQ61_011464 [Plenodomus lingam]|uniref:uncharacterized protein n=1 Tax=Leptosphaeria maculans TaxID=5022 RepID=UPI003329E050|nr:hypothetical protein IAQ61_011464 [Plenodomus lingam]